jgi:hypothetical protein
MNKIEKIYDNTKDGIPNYSIQLVDGKMLYARGVPLYPVPNRGDIIKFTIVNTKTSEKGNQYSNIKDVEIVNKGNEGIPNPEPLDNVVNNVIPMVKMIHKEWIYLLQVSLVGLWVLGSFQFMILQNLLKML